MHVHDSCALTDSARAVGWSPIEVARRWSAVQPVGRAQFRAASPPPRSSQDGSAAGRPPGAASNGIAHRPPPSALRTQRTTKPALSGRLRAVGGGSFAAISRQGSRAASVGVWPRSACTAMHGRAAIGATRHAFDQASAQPLMWSVHHMSASLITLGRSVSIFWRASWLLLKYSLPPITCQVEMSIGKHWPLLAPKAQKPPY